ncbi:MAG TPA: hypothetical protein VGQ46_10620 [Thermoanaerobaculia bacterium]|jgi:hypothetical protein|nr:hypothetical protein [Thermoanaerobaculia bacterium]
MKRLLVVAACLLIANAASAGSSINNDDTCDIKVGPAATLLLPYFEIDVTGNTGQTTLFTITNVSRYPQIAHVTLWSDWGFPVLTFNIYLTGYGQQAINLADVLLRNTIASANGTSDATPPGRLSTGTSPNLRASPGCIGNPGTVPAAVIATVRSALTKGIYQAGNLSCGQPVGGIHANAIGYATIDVVSHCTPRFPNDPAYFTEDLLYDNVLIGDYQQLGPRPEGAAAAGFEAAGNPMVHIRAVPEGGSAGSNVPTSLPYTFYDRYTPSTTRSRDRRQPLPSTFAARFIQGGAGAFVTNVTIWREGYGAGACGSRLAINDYAPVADIVRFDERENVFSLYCTQPCVTYTRTLSLASSTSTSSAIYPTLTGTDLGGWIYLNLNNSGDVSYSVTTHDVGGEPFPTRLSTVLAPARSTTSVGPRPSQNWVTVTMFATIGGNRMTAEFDAASLGNGCSPAAFFGDPFLGQLSAGKAVPIGPAGGVFVCPPGPTLTNGTTTQCTGTNVNPIP